MTTEKTPAQVAAGQVSAVLASTMMVEQPWNKLSAAEKAERQRAWEKAITQNPSGAMQAIVGDIKAHPDLGPAWNTLGEYTRGVTQDIMTAILRKNALLSETPSKGV